MATPAQQFNRDVINFDAAGRTYEIALKYPTGKVIANGRVMFSTVSNEVFFVSQEDADKIYDLELRPQEQFRVTGNGKGRGIQVERIPRVQQAGERQGVQTAAVPVPVQAPAPVKSEAPSQDNTLSGIMASSYIQAIDALIIASDYAAHKGVPFRLSGSEVRAAAHCIFIALSRGVNTWQR